MINYYSLYVPMTAVVVIFMRLPTDFSSKHSNCPLHACTISISKTVRKIATCSIQFLCYQIAITPASRTLLPLLLLHLYWLFIHRQGCHSHCWIVGQSRTTIFSCHHCCQLFICAVFAQSNKKPRAQPKFQTPKVDEPVIILGGLANRYDSLSCTCIVPIA